MPLPAQSFLGWRVSISILHIIAILSTLVRLVHRRRRLDLWWDDWATVLPLICDVFYFAIFLLQIQNKLHGAFFTSYWLECILFLTIIWVSRTSLALSIARIFPPRHPFRRIALGLTGIFLLLWIAFTLKSAIECYDNSSQEWWDGPLPLCLARRHIFMPGVFIAVTCDFLADIILIIAPIAMLWGLKLPVVERRLVLVLFSCSLLTLASSVFFVSLGLSPMPQLGPDLFLLLDMGPQLEGTASIIVCNLMVLATLIYRISKNKFPQPRKPPPVQQNRPPTASPVRAATGRRGTSIFRDLLPDLYNNSPNGTVRTAADVNSATRTQSTVPTSFTVPSFVYESSQQPTSNRNPDSQLVRSDPQSISPQNTNPQNTNPQNTNPQNTNPQNTNPQNTNPQNISPHLGSMSLV